MLGAKPSPVLTGLREPLSPAPFLEGLEAFLRSAWDPRRETAYRGRETLSPRNILQPALFTEPPSKEDGLVTGRAFVGEQGSATGAGPNYLGDSGRIWNIHQPPVLQLCTPGSAQPLLQTNVEQALK